MRILLTGAASGIGRATADKLVDRGHGVIAVDMDCEGLEVLEGAVTRCLDICDEEAVAGLIDEEDFDVLVNCAGYYEQGSIEDMPIETVERIFYSNVFGLLNVTRKALPTLREKQGRVINVSSVAGRITMPFSGQYCASKKAVEAISDALRMEVSDQEVDVTVVEPGVIETGFNERARNALGRYIPDSIYSEEYERILEQGGLEGVDAEVPAGKIVDVIEKDNPKPRYQTPLRAKIFVLAESIFPTPLKYYVKKQI